jgi:hypothetical protein
LETLRRLAVQSNLLFHVKKYNKEIKPKDFATQASVNEQKEISMNIMEGLYGTSKSSYLKMENARMIVRHSARIKEHVIGDRGRHINSIFVENAQGERFLFPVNMLSGARAMTQHVNKGGNFADEVGSQIVRMAQDFRNLAQVTNHINNLPGLQESIKDNEKVEAHGVKGMKSTPWRKIFKNLDALNAWVEKNDAEVHAYSAVEQNTTHESAIALRTAVMEAMRGTKRSFSRIYTESTYLGESERIASNSNLMEDSESLSESLAAIAGILGEGVSEEAMLSVARNVTIEAATAPQLDEEFDDVVEGHDPQIRDDGWFSIDLSNQLDETDRAEYDAKLGALGYHVDVDYEWSIAGGDDCPDGISIESVQMRQDPQVMQVIGDLYGPGAYDTSDFDGDGEMEEGHTIDVAVEGAFTDTPNNPQIREFEQWLESFDPDSMFGQKVAEAPAQWEVHGIIGLDSKFCKKFDSEDARQEWLDKHEHSGKFDVTKLVDPQHAVAEGKSYKRNKDEDADDKKAKDQERKDAAKNKKQPVEEGKSFKRNDDDEADVKDKRKEDKQKRDEKKKPVEEGKSFKRNDDEDDTDVKAKRKEDKQKRDEKKTPVEEGKSFKRNDDDETDVKAKRKEEKEKRDAKKPVEEGKSFKRNDDDDVDADTKKKDDKQKRDEKKKQPVSEDSSQFSGSFETNINAEDGSVVSAKVTYVPNEAGAATILSVVRGDTGEDVLPFMDDDDILHVEGLCADDIAQQGSEQFAMSESDGDGMIRDDGWFSINAEFMLDEDDRAAYDNDLRSLGYQVDVDYEWSIAGGDDCPDGIIITSAKMKNDSTVLELLSHIHGPGAYGESTTIPRNPHGDFKKDVMTGGVNGGEQNQSEIARMKALAGLK